MPSLVAEKSLLSIDELLLFYFEPEEKKGFKDIEDFYNKTRCNGLQARQGLKIDESDLEPLKREPDQ